MPFLPSKTTFVRPLRETNDVIANHHRNFGSPVHNKMQQLEVSESNNLIGLNGEVNLKNMDEIKKVYLENLNSVHSKLFSGVEEIQKWKTSVEMESKQKNKKVDELLQTIEVQRKTILDLQIQNENFSYQLSEETQQRNFVLEKLHSTKELCSALKKHYNTLQGYYEYRNKIEEAFNIADAKRLSAIEILKNKFERVCREHSEKVGYLNDALASETNKALNLKETLEQQLSLFENEKESLCRMIENQQLEIQRLSGDINEERNKSKLVIEEKNALKFKVQELENLIEMHSSNLKETEETLQITQNEKLELEKKLLSEKTYIDNYQLEYERCLEAAKLQEKESEEKISVLNETVSSLEDKIHNIETDMNDEKHRNEMLMSTISALQEEKDNLEAIISEAKNELVDYEQLKTEYRTLEAQVSEFVVKEEHFNVTVEKLNEELLQCKSEKERKSELHDEREECLKKIVEDYQNKIVETEDKLKSLEESNTELLHKVKILEEDLNMKGDEVCVRDEKMQNLESAVNAYAEQLENLRIENIALKDKMEAERNAVCLECEQLTSQLKEKENLKVTLQKAEEELLKHKAENTEIMKILNDTEASYNNDRMVKEEEIIGLQELVRRLEDEIRVMNVKVEEFSTLKSLNQKQKDAVEELKTTTTKQKEKLKDLKCENKKLKEDLENLKHFTQEDDLNNLKSENEKLKEDLENLKHLTQEDELNNLKSENEKLKENLENLKNLTVRQESLKENKENMAEILKIEDQNKLVAAKKDKMVEISAGRKKRKTKSRSLSQSKSFEKESVFSELAKNTFEKKGNVKAPPTLLKDSDTDSTSSDATFSGKDTRNIPKKQFKDEAAAVTHPDSTLKKEEKQKSSYLESNKWEVDSSGSEYLELAFDKDSEKIMGLTPQRSPAASVKLNTLTTKKSFTSSLKRDHQSIILDTPVKKLGLPLKKNKTELEFSPWMQSIRTPDRNLQMRNTSSFNTPSTPADKRKILGTTSTPSGQRKFFKTPLSDRDNVFKKPTSQPGWSDFLKSSK